MNIAIIGCGFAGLSSALFFGQKHHNITLFDKFENPEPVGAGILIQPSSQEVLKKLDLYQDLLQEGEKVFQMQGINHKKKEIFLTRYEDYHPDAFGLGIQRKSLFNILYRKCLSFPNIQFQFGKEINSFDNLTGYDLIIVANGTHSQLRTQLPIAQHKEDYPYGCIWTKMPSDYSPNKLSQYVKDSREMFGFLPSGIENNQRMVSVFWSLPVNINYDLDVIFNKMQTYLEGAPSEIMQNIRAQNFAFATYADVYMKHYSHNNIVVIGDAAHAMSPQLGQGANMALLDSYFLNKYLDEKDICKSLEQYSKARKRHLRFYSQASKFLTPLFQSDSTINGILRDYLFGVSKQIQFSRKMSSQIMCGKRQSWLYNKEIIY